MIHLSLAIHLTESSSATPIFTILTGTAVEALPDNPGQIQVSLSEDYQPPYGYEVRYTASEGIADDPDLAVPIEPGEVRLSEAAFANTAHVKLYLVRLSDGMIVQQVPLSTVTVLESSGTPDVSSGPRLTDAIASANGAAAARGAVTTDEGSGILYWIATRSDIAPSVSDIVAGRDRGGAAASNFGSVPVETEGTIRVTVPNLVAGTTYYLHFAQIDSSGNLSEVISSAALTPIPTVIEDLTNPVVEDIFARAALRTAWQGVTVDDYAADNGATITDVKISYEVDGHVVESGEIEGKAGDVLRVLVAVTASDGTQANFAYGSAFVSAAPVVDTIPPVLSTFELSADGPKTVRGSVTTSEAGGTLRWIGLETSAKAPPESDLLTKLSEPDLPSIAMSGTIPVTEPGIVPLAFGELAPERSYDFYCCHKDDAGNLSNLVKASARTLSAGNLTITVDDFSRDRAPFHSRRAAKSETAQASTSSAAMSKENVIALVDDSNAGSRHEGSYKIPGKTELPSGMSVSGNRIDVTGRFTGWLEGWDLTGYMVSWRDGEVRIRNSILGERDGPAGIHSYVDIYPAAILVEISNNDILGPNRYGGAGVAIKYRTAGDGAGATGPGLAPGRVARNRFFGLSSDALKPTGGVIEENVILYRNNLDGPALLWSETQNYAKGELARNGSDNVFRSKSDGNRRNPVPDRKSDTPAWESLDPHCDAINPATVTAPLLIRANYINMDADPERSVGMNNAIRSVPNTNSTLPHDQVDIVGNVLIGPTEGNSKLIQATDNGNPNHVPDRFYNNWIKARNQSDVLHATQATGTVWENNLDLDTGGILSGTADTVADSSLPWAVEPSSTYVAQVTRNGTATPGYIVEGRAVPEGDTTPTGWVQIAETDSEGHWSGTLAVPRGPHPYRFEVRLKNAPDISAKTSRTFMSGVLIAVHTQSDIASPALKTRAPWVTIKPEPLLENDLVQMFYLDGFDINAPEQPEANLKRVFLSDKTPYSPGMAAIANTFIDLMPDTPVALIMHTVSGTSPTKMANDSDNGRNWQNDKKLHDFVVRDGNQPGLHASYFSSSYTGISKNFGEALAPIFTGRLLNGSEFRTPGRHGYGYDRSVWIDHTYMDLYDPSFTKTMILPIEAIEDSLQADFLDNPKFAGLFVEGKFDMYNSSVSGHYNASKNRMDDTNHANSHKEWGGPRRMRMWALSMIEALGEQNLEQPLLDILEAAPNGDANMIRIGSTSGPISTLRKQLDLPDLKASKYPAYGDVYGIYVNDRYVDAYIGNDKGDPAKEGWIYVPKPTGAFRNADIIGTRSTGFGRDQVSKPASGAPSAIDYYLDDAVLSKPVVPSGIHRVWGLHAIMPKEAGDIFSYSDISSGKWAGQIPVEADGDEKEEAVSEAEDENVEVPPPPPNADDYAMDFSTNLTASPLFTASDGAILRFEPGRTWSFPANGKLTGAMEMTGKSFSDTRFSVTPDIRLSNQSFEIDLAAYVSSLPDQNTSMAVRIYCDHDGGSDLLSTLYPSAGTLAGTILVDAKGRKFTCNGTNGKVRVEFFIDNPRNDKRRIALMRLAVRAN